MLLTKKYPIKFGEKKHTKSNQNKTIIKDKQ